MIKNIFKFLQKYHQKGRPVLVGFSGGPDSLALCHLLIDSGVDVHLAHVDHGWREESAEEALLLQRYAARLAVPFYVHRLQEKTTEDGSRNGRLQFFSELYFKGDFQALALGHHADDRAETILKRVFEGANLFAWKGMQPMSFLKGMCIWRPLLQTSKKDILAWIDHRKLAPLEDRTNYDIRFLRARMRKELFPELAKMFGKEILSNVLKVGDLAGELEGYFRDILEKYSKQVCKEGGKAYFIVPSYMHSFELRMFLQLWLVEGEKRFLSREAIQTIAQLALSCKAKKEVMGVLVDRGRISLTVNRLNNSKDKINSAVLF